MTIMDVKPGDALVYVVGGVEYSAVALGEPSFGANPNWRGLGYNLNVSYLGRDGVAVKVLGAQALSAALSEDEAQHLYLEMAKLNRIFRQMSADEQMEYVAAQEKAILAQPRTTGWKLPWQMAAAPVDKTALAPIESKFVDVFATMPLVSQKDLLLSIISSPAVRAILTDEANEAEFLAALGVQEHEDPDAPPMPPDEFVKRFNAALVGEVGQTAGMTPEDRKKAMLETVQSVDFKSMLLEDEDSFAAIRAAFGIPFEIGGQAGGAVPDGGTYPTGTGSAFSKFGWWLWMLLKRDFEVSERLTIGAHKEPVPVAQPTCSFDEGIAGAVGPAEPEPEPTPAEEPKQ
jgi:hypothetical protein